MLRTSVALFSLSASTAIFFFFRSATVLIFLSPGLSSSNDVVIEDRDGAGAGRDLGVGAQDRKIGLPAVELRERLGVVAVGHDLEPQPRGIVLQQRGELGGEPRLGAVGLADGKDQRLGIAQPGPAAPHRGGGQDQGQDRKQHDLRAVAFDHPRTACAAFRVAALGLQRSWLIPDRGRFAVKSAPQAVQMNS